MKPQQMKISLVLTTIRTNAEFSCETSWTWKAHRGNVWISQENGASAEELRFTKTTQAIEPPPAKHDKTTPGSGDNGARANDASTPPQAPVKSSQAEAGPGEGSALRRPPPRMKNEASMQGCKCLCARL